MSRPRQVLFVLITLAAGLVVEILTLDYPTLNWFIGGLLVATFLCHAWYFHVHRKRLGQLTAGLREVAEGNLEHPPIVLDRKDDLGSLANELEVLRLNLKRRRIEHEQALLRARESARATFNALPHAIALLSIHGKIEIANPLAGTLFHLAETSTAALPPWLPPLLAQVQETKSHATASAPLQVFDKNRELFFTPLALPVLDADQQLIGILVILENATELRQVNEAKSGLLALVSHELKTPLTSIQMSIHLLLEDTRLALTERQRDLLKTAGEDADRLHELIQKLLDQGRR